MCTCVGFFFQNPLVTPAITPRGTAQCTKSLMTTHGELAKKYDVPIQASFTFYKLLVTTCNSKTVH